VSLGEPLRLRQRDQVLQIQGGGDQHHARQAQPLPAGLQKPANYETLTADLLSSINQRDERGVAPADC
jgi:hypothetical protein